MAMEISLEEFNRCDAMRAIEGTPEERAQAMQQAVVTEGESDLWIEFPDGSEIIGMLADSREGDHTSPSLTKASQADKADGSPA